MPMPNKNAVNIRVLRTVRNANKPVSSGQVFNLLTEEGYAASYNSVTAILSALAKQRRVVQVKGRCDACCGLKVKYQLTRDGLEHLKEVGVW